VLMGEVFCNRGGAGGVSHVAAGASDEIVAGFFACRRQRREPVERGNARTSSMGLCAGRPVTILGLCAEAPALGGQWGGSAVAARLLSG